MESQCLLAGVDTLELGFCVDKYRLRRRHWNALDAAQESSRESYSDNKLAAIELCGNKFLVK